MTAYSVKNIVFLLITGVFSGLCNGLIGCGGGIFIVYALTYLARREGAPDVFDQKDVFATAVASILPMSAVSAVIYARQGDVGDVSGVYGYILPAAVGGVVGAFLLDRIKSDALRRLFAALVMWAGASMILRRAGVF